MAKVVHENGKYVLRDDWSVEDILNEAELMNFEITYEQAVEVMQLIVLEFDANYGINWDIINHAILNIVDEK